MPILQEQFELVQGPQIPIGVSYFDRLQVDRGKVHGEACPTAPPSGAALDSFVMLHYYDLPLCERVVYERTGDQYFRTLFQRCADSWYKHPQWIGEGSIRLWPDSISPAPRHAGVKGLILRAMDGRPEMWTWINDYTRFHLDHWCKKRINDPNLFYGLREGAFSLHYAILLAYCLPDSFPNAAQLRAQYLADCELIATEYYGRLQKADGSWRWDDPDYTDSDGGQLKGITQPFMVGLLLAALVDVHRVSTSEIVKTNILNQVTKSCRHLYSNGPYSKQFIAGLNVNLKGFHYFYHGGTTVNPAKYEQGSYPANYNTTDPSDVQNARQPIGLIIAAYGYAYKQTGDAFFKMAGDEMWDSAYGSTDGIHNYMAGDAKSYNQNCRRAGSYLALAGTITTPPPDPTLPPTTNKPVVTITSPVEGATVAGKINVTTSVTSPTPITVVYLVVNESVSGSGATEPSYSIAWDTTKLSDGQYTLYVRAWNSSGIATDSLKIKVTVKNAVTPPILPETAIGALKTGVVWGRSDAAKKKSATEQRALGWYFYSDGPGDTATFIYTGVRL